MEEVVVEINPKQINHRLANSLSYKLSLPVLIASFFIFAFGEALLSVNLLNMVAPTVVESSPLFALILEVVLIGFLAFLIFEILFFIYKFIAGLSIFSYLIPALAYKKSFYYAMSARNLIMGLLRVIMLVFPFTYIYSLIVDLVVLFVCFIFAVLKLVKNYCNDLIAPFVFRSYARPFMILMFLYVAGLIVGYLL